VVKIKQTQEKQRTLAGIQADEVNKQLNIVKEKVETIEGEITERQQEKRMRKNKKLPNDPSSSSSSDEEPDKKKIHFEIKKKKRKYNLIFPNVATNRVSGDDIRKALEASDTGVQLELSLKYLDLKFTNFNVSRGNMNDDIYERMAQTGCIPQPRGIVCTKCGYNVYDGEDPVLEGSMRRHYTSTHNRWCKDNGMEQFFKLYGPNCSGKFISANGITEFDYFQRGMYYCKKLDCQKINSKKASNLVHLHGIHGHRWDAWGI
jgi:hypothetical protein